MEEDDKGCPMIRMGVSGRMLFLVPAYPDSPGQKAVKPLCVVCVCCYCFPPHRGVKQRCTRPSARPSLSAPCYRTLIGSPMLEVEPTGQHGRTATGSVRNGAEGTSTIVLPPSCIFSPRVFSRVRGIA